MTIDLRRQYGRLAAGYDENRGLFDMNEVIHTFYRDFTVERGNLLDLGCGAGEPMSRWFVDRGWTVRGIDYTPEMVDLARKYVEEMDATVADMRDVSFPPETYDGIISVYSLFHLPSEDQFMMLERMYRWLTRGGRALFTYATKSYTGHDVFSGYKLFMGEELFYSHRTPAELSHELDRIGFVTESMIYRDIGGEIFLWVTVVKSGNVLE